MSSLIFKIKSMYPNLSIPVLAVCMPQGLRSELNGGKFIRTNVGDPYRSFLWTLVLFLTFSYRISLSRNRLWFTSCVHVSSISGLCYLLSTKVLYSSVILHQGTMAMVLFSLMKAWRLQGLGFYRTCPLFWCCISTTESATQWRLHS